MHGIRGNRGYVASRGGRKRMGWYRIYSICIGGVLFCAAAFMFVFVGMKICSFSSLVRKASGFPDETASAGVSTSTSSMRGVGAAQSYGDTVPQSQAPTEEVQCKCDETPKTGTSHLTECPKCPQCDGKNALSEAPSAEPIRKGANGETKCYEGKRNLPASRASGESWGDHQPVVHVMTIAGDASSFGVNPDKQMRTVYDWANTVAGVDFSGLCVRVSLLVSSEKLRDEVNGSPLHVGLPRADAYFRNNGFVSPKDDAARHSNSIQKKRRSALARYRNSLLSLGLAGEDEYVLWIDSDVVHIPADAVARFVDSGYDIIAPTCKRGSDVFDLNSWKGNRIRIGEDAIRRGSFVPMPGPGVKHIDQVADGEELDAVGGAVLFSKAEVFREGAMFPPYYAVGTQWDTPGGFDGIETEGLCYVARQIGYSCHAMPSVVVQHSLS